MDIFLPIDELEICMTSKLSGCVFNGALIAHVCEAICFSS